MNRKPNTFTDFDATWYVSLTEKCNWKCSYCDFPLKENTKTITQDQLCKQIEIFREVLNNNYTRYKNIELEIEGGEIGCLDISLLDIWFNSDLSLTYQVITNGLFLRKGFHEKYASKIHYIIYHVIPNFVSCEQQFDVYNFEDDRLDYTVVVTRDNYKEFVNLVNKYKNLMWLPHFLQHRIPEKEYDYLTQDEFGWLYEQLKDVSNVRQHIKDRLYKLSRSNPYKRFNLFCANVYTKPLIDLPNNLIRRCCISGSGDAVEFNVSNLLKLKNNVFMYPPIEKICENCIAGFSWLDHQWNNLRPKIILYAHNFNCLQRQI